jgi:hypothetical protein
VDKWYKKLYDLAPLDIQSRMLLYTSEESTTIQSNWNDKIIFYSPKITTGVDITCIESSEQFMYITGQSVSSINLLQMATRTRNMKQLSYYSSVKCVKSLYESYQDCEDKLMADYLRNQLGYSFSKISDCKEYKEFGYEDTHINLYLLNCYSLDIHNTDKLYFFKEELRTCGFTIMQPTGTKTPMNKVMDSELREQSQAVKDVKYDLLVQSFETAEVVSLPSSLKALKDRCDVLKINDSNDALEYREVIEDEDTMTHFLNYSRLKKSFKICQQKVDKVVDRKMSAGLEKTAWFKIKYVHMLAQICNMGEDLFALEKLTMPELTDQNKLIITTIKKLYDKRDKVVIDNYDLASITQLYKFMIDNLTKKLGLIKSVKINNRGEDKDKRVYKMNEDAVKKYDKLIEIMRPNEMSAVDYEEMPDDDE